MHEALAHALGAKKILSYLLPVEFILSLSALYEVAEWLVADVAYSGTEQGMDFLGMQGDIWDAQKDIALALVGGLIAMSAAFALRKK